MGQARAGWKAPEEISSVDRTDILFPVFDLLREVYINQGKFLVGFMLSTQAAEQINNSDKKDKKRQIKNSDQKKPFIQRKKMLYIDVKKVMV